MPPDTPSSLLGAASLVGFHAEQVGNVACWYDRIQPGLRDRLFEVGALSAELCGWLADDLGRDVQSEEDRRVDS